MRQVLLLAGALGLFLLPVSAQTSGAAKVVSLTGQVSVLRDNYPWALAAGQFVQPQQIIVTGPDGFARFQLADGSHFEVFPNSRTIFRQNPGNWRELLDVVLGRVKVYIQKLAGQPNNNSVYTPTAVIAVRGTVFDVVVEDTDDTTLVSVDEGQVKVTHRLKPGEKILNPGEWVRVYRNQPLAAIGIDRGGAVLRAMRAAADALYEAVYRTRGSGGTATGAGAPPGGGGTGPAGQGDKDKGDPPPAPPPPQ